MSRPGDYPLPLATATITVVGTNTFQDRVRLWVEKCFDVQVANDKTARNHRFLEEALELVQAGGLSKDEAYQLVDYVFNRPVGELKQEVGGTITTLAALCAAYDVDLVRCGEDELERNWKNIDRIHQKHLNKPKFGPLPGSIE